MLQLLKIADWDELYENSRTRDMKRMQWVPVPCKFDGEGYTELVVGHKNGPAHYAAWMAFLLSAARTAERGTLIAGVEHHTTRRVSQRRPRFLSAYWTKLYRGLSTLAGSFPNP